MRRVGARPSRKTPPSKDVLRQAADELFHRYADNYLPQYQSVVEDPPQPDLAFDYIDDWRPNGLACSRFIGLSIGLLAALDRIAASFAAVFPQDDKDPITQEHYDRIVASDFTTFSPRWPLNTL